MAMAAPYPPAPPTLVVEDSATGAKHHYVPHPHHDYPAPAPPAHPRHHHHQPQQPSPSPSTSTPSFPPPVPSGRSAAAARSREGSYTRSPSALAPPHQRLPTPKVSPPTDDSSPQGPRSPAHPHHHHHHHQSHPGYAYMPPPPPSSSSSASGSSSSQAVHHHYTSPPPPPAAYYGHHYPHAPPPPPPPHAHAHAYAYSAYPPGAPVPVVVAAPTAAPAAAVVLPAHRLSDTSAARKKSKHRRQSHIQAEQRRRHNINEGYDALRLALRAEASQASVLHLAARRVGELEKALMAIRDALEDPAKADAEHVAVVREAIAGLGLPTLQELEDAKVAHATAVQQRLEARNRDDDDDSP